MKQLFLALFALVLSCAPCTPLSGPCLFVYIKDANTNAPITDASVFFIIPDGVSFPTNPCGARGVTPGCFTRQGRGCTGTLLVRATHPMFATFEQQVTAPPGCDCRTWGYRRASPMIAVSLRDQALESRLAAPGAKGIRAENFTAETER